MYAIVETGGKQYKVRVGQTLDVELLDANAGDTVEFDRVLAVSGEEGVQVGSPVLESAKVSATIVDHVRGPKLTIFKYKPSERYRVKTGHRQNYTRLKIESIEL
jgi:large subunit ribosomal protein L21